jgi:hypothetical protein
MIDKRGLKVQSLEATALPVFGLHGLKTNDYRLQRTLAYPECPLMTDCMKLMQRLVLVIEPLKLCQQAVIKWVMLPA